MGHAATLKTCTPVGLRGVRNPRRPRRHNPPRSLVIAKATGGQRLLDIPRSIPAIQDNPKYRCWTWVALALEAIKADGKRVGTAVPDQTEIETTAREYVAQKRQGGRCAAGNMRLPKPTLDTLGGRETVS